MSVCTPARQQTDRQRAAILQVLAQPVALVRWTLEPSQGNGIRGGNPKRRISSTRTRKVTN